MFKLCQCSREWAGRGGAVRRQPGGRAAHCSPLPCLSLQSMLTATFQVTQLKKPQPPMAAATAAPDSLAGLHCWKAASPLVLWLSPAVLG